METMLETALRDKEEGSQSLSLRTVWVASSGAACCHIDLHPNGIRLLGLRGFGFSFSLIACDLGIGFISSQDGRPSIPISHPRFESSEQNSCQVIIDFRIKHLSNWPVETAGIMKVG